MAHPPAPRFSPSMGLVILAEGVVRLLCGLVLAPLVGYGGGWLVSLLVPDLGMGLLGIMVYLAVLGFVIGAPAGVTLAGRRMRQAGSWWISLSGAALGAFIVVGLAQTGLFRGALGVALGLAAAAALGLAVAGYNLRRRRFGASS